MSPKALMLAAILGLPLLLAGCGKDKSETQAAPATAATTAAAPQAQAAAPAPEKPEEPKYYIKPFPVIGIAKCDNYAAAARRCLNLHGTNEQRHKYEDGIQSMLEDLRPKQGEEPPSMWDTQRCTYGMSMMEQRFPQCQF